MSSKKKSPEAAPPEMTKKDEFYRRAPIGLALAGALHELMADGTLETGANSIAGDVMSDFDEVSRRFYWCGLIYI
jgi:hypothetical protein